MMRGSRRRGGAGGLGGLWLAALATSWLVALLLAAAEIVTTLCVRLPLALLRGAVRRRPPPAPPRVSRGLLCATGADGRITDADLEAAERWYDEEHMAGARLNRPRGPRRTA
jgi:hypothetical protein